MSRRAKQRAEIGLKDLHYDLLKEVYQKLPIHEQVRFGLTSRAVNDVHSVEFQNLVTRGVDQMPKLRLLQEYYSRRLMRPRINDAFTVERRARYPADDYRSLKYRSGEPIGEIIRNNVRTRLTNQAEADRHLAVIKRRLDYSGVVAGGDDLKNKRGEFSTYRARPIDIGREIIPDARGPEFTNIIPQRVITDQNRLLRFTM